MLEPGSDIMPQRRKDQLQAPDPRGRKLGRTRIARGGYKIWLQCQCPSYGYRDNGLMLHPQSPRSKQSTNDTPDIATDQPVTADRRMTHKPR
jgi:hypothetical protein